MLVEGTSTYTSTVLSSAEIMRQNLALLRDRHNITQEQAAALVGVEYKYYQAVETGRRDQIRLVTLDKLAQAFGLTGSGLLSETLPPSAIQSSVGPIGRQRAKAKKRRRRRKKLQKKPVVAPPTNESASPAESPKV